MVKFKEIFEYLEYRSQEMECDCCRGRKENVTLYKHKDGIKILCDQCRDFIEELLNQ